MSSKYWLLSGSLALGAAQSVACTSEFTSCESRRRCPAGGASGMAGAAEAGAGSDEAGADQGGSAGLDAQGGEAGIADNAGTGGMAGDSSVDAELEIAPPNFATGKTYVPFTGKISASGAAHYNWSITSGALPAGLALQGAESATVTIDGSPTEAGQFPLRLSVTDGSTTKAVDVTLAITHSALFLSDRNVAGVSELFVAEIGAGSAAAPVRLSASIPSGGGVSSYAWSPDGSKVLYLATQSSGGAAELWVASLGAPGTAQRVSAPGAIVSQMVWLLTGNICAYITSTGDAYLVDLSSSTPGVSKLVVPGPGTPSALTPSPNGKSLTVGTTEFDSNNHVNLQTVTYVTWASGTPKSVKLYGGTPAESFLSFSYDGRFGMNFSVGGAGWWDLILPSPKYETLLNSNSGSASFSPNAQALVLANASVPGNLSLGIFDGGSLDITVVAEGKACSYGVESWSPDGKNVIFRCTNDIRGIDGVLTAAVGTDFSLLPTGFFSNPFTDIQTLGWSPDSKWIALRADRDVDTQYDLVLSRWSAPGVAYKAHANGVGPGVTTWAFAPNSQSVAFVGSIAPQNNTALYLTKMPASGAPPTATLVSAPANSVVQADINWLPGSRMLTYRAIVSGAPQLFAIPVAVDGTAGSPVSISGASGGRVSSYQLAPTR